MGRIILVTGKSQGGKTRFVQAKARVAAAEGLRVCGVLSLPAYTEGSVSGIQAQLLPSGDERSLAIHRDPFADENPLDYGRWRFDESTIEWTNTALADESPCDVLVVDELGPLEFERQSGFTAAFDRLDRRDFAVAYVVVRTGNVAQACERFPRAEVVTIGEPSH